MDRASSEQRRIRLTEELRTLQSSLSERLDREGICTEDELASVGERARGFFCHLLASLIEDDWKPTPSNQIYDGDRWSYGEVTTARGTELDVLRGFIEPIFTVPILRQVPRLCVAYLISIGGGDDFLKRETHGMGWHYHYLDRRRRRSNVILSWDTRWQPPTPQTKPPTTRALFVEPHAEKKAEFTAKPRQWGEEKRRSIYDACAPDLEKWDVSEFKCAANKSEVVYPLGRTLTPRAQATSAKELLNLKPLVERSSA